MPSASLAWLQTLRAGAGSAIPSSTPRTDAQMPHHGIPFPTRAKAKGQVSARGHGRCSPPHQQRGQPHRGHQISVSSVWAHFARSQHVQRVIKHLLAWATYCSAEQGHKPEQSYAYISQLLALDNCRPLHARHLPPYLLQVTTPLLLGTWRNELKLHPDQQFADFILRGIESGFRIGFRYDRQALRSRSNNMLSATEAPQVVSNYLEEELALNRIVELPPGQAQKLDGLQCSPFGVIPKKHKPGKWRLIVDLSSPEHFSVNDGITKELCSLTYTSVDDVVACVLKAGKGALLAKMDIKQAYRNIPVHPDDRPLLGMKWQGRVFVDKTLPFGLRSAPLIFSAVADALQWIMQRRGIKDLFHYIDDFITVGGPGSSECASNV